MSPAPRPAAARIARTVPMLLLLLAASGCRTATPRPPAFAERTATAHGIDDWEIEQAFQGELLVRSDDGGGVVVDLRFLIEIDGPRSRLTIGDGTPEGETTTVLFDGERWRPVRDTAPHSDAQTLKIWPTLIALPFRMAAPGVRIEELGQRELGGVPYDAARVRFPKQVGGLGDWVMVYVDPETRLICAVVYAEAGEPRAITFYDVEDVSGVKLATEWKLWKWAEEEGIYDKPVATGRLFNLGFTTIGKGAFPAAAAARPQDR